MYKALFSFIEGLTIDEVEKNIGSLWFNFADHSQLRWLGLKKGCSYGFAAVFNALWDINC